MIFRNALNTEFKVVLSAALTIGFFSLLSKLLGVVRNRIFAGEFGAGDTLDAYFAAFLIPDFLYNILIVGVLSSVFIPIFAEYLARDKAEAWRLVNVVLTVFSILLVVFSVFAVFFAPELVSLIAVGFDDAKQAMTVDLARIMFVSTIVLGVSNIVGSVLQTHKVFFSFALAPVMYNLGIILGALFFVGPFGAKGLALGVVLGALLHLGIQLPSLFRVGFSFHPVFDLRHPGLRKIVWLSLPRTVGLAAQQFNFVVITAIASTISAGSIAVFNFANDLQFVPIGIVALSFASAVFPLLSASFARRDMRLFLDEFYLAVNQILFLVIPISVLLILERAQIVRVILGYGQFSWEDTRLTAAVLGAFALSIFAQSLIPLFVRAFYAIHNTLTPVAINISSVFLNIGLSFYFLHLMRAGGSFARGIAELFRVSDLEAVAVLALPLAFSVSSIINLLWLYFALSRKIEPFDSTSILRSLTRINIAAFIMALAVYPMLVLLSAMVNMQTFTGIFIQGAGAFLTGVVAYLVVAYFLKIPEFFIFWQAFFLPVKKIFLSRVFPILSESSDK